MNKENQVGNASNVKGKRAGYFRPESEEKINSLDAHFSNSLARKNKKNYFFSYMDLGVTALSTLFDGKHVELLKKQRQKGRVVARNA